MIENFPNNYGTTRIRIGPITARVEIMTSCEFEAKER